jgi:hypothetical protein
VASGEPQNYCRPNPASQRMTVDGGGFFTRKSGAFCIDH